jgi:SUF system NifU family Fe-S assembly protein
MNYSNEMYREIILDHVKNPRNKKKIDDDRYLKAYLKNPSCGDDVLVYVLIQNNIVKDISYEVNGCSICVSSVSIMSELLMGESLDNALLIIENFNNMITNKEFDEALLKEAIALKGVANLLPRIKCATLGYKAFLKAIGKDDTNE